MGPIIAHLRRMKDVFNLYHMDVGLWDPDQAFVDGFAARLKFGRPEIDPKTLLGEVEGSFVDPLNDPLRSPPPRELPSSFAMAAELHRRALAAARSGHATTEALQCTRADYDELLNQHTSVAPGGWSGFASTRKNRWAERTPCRHVWAPATPT